MRINKFVAQTSGLSRRAADAAILAKRVFIDGELATIGQTVVGYENITLDGTRLYLPKTSQTIMLHKPIGYVVSREGQGGLTIYDLLPLELHRLKPIGRLDKNSSGLLILTDDGQLTQQLTHPKLQKIKIYNVELNRPLSESDKQKLERGVMLEDGLSRLQADGKDFVWTITMHEGRNRQIRRTFASLGYTVTRLHRTHFGPYQLGQLAPTDYVSVSTDGIL